MEAKAQREFTPADEFTPSETMLSRGMALQKVQTQYTTAITVQKPRDIDKIQKAVLREAEYAGEDFYYSWTVQGKKGPKTIEGPSIGLTMSLAREWTNCAVDVNVDIQGIFDVFTASFVDIEKGFTVKRAFKQKRTVAPGRYDADRWEDMEFQKAQSKAIRNVIASGVPRWLVNQAIEKAKDAVLNKISKEGIEKASEKAINFLGQYGVSIDRIIKRVGKPRNEWSTEDIAMLRGCASELKDGQASADDLFPPEKEEGKNLKPDPNGKKPEGDPYRKKDLEGGSEPEGEKPDAETIAHIKGCRKAGFEKNHLEWRNGSLQVQAAMLVRCKELYGIEYNEWLGNQEPESKSTEPEESVSEQGQGEDMLLCPELEGETRPVTYCREKCLYQSRCQTFEEWKHENEE